MRRERDQRNRRVQNTGGAQPPVAHLATRPRAATPGKWLALPLLLWTAATQGQSGGPIAGLSGNWRAGTTTMDVNVESWGDDCGPRPQSSRASGGGSVKVSVEGPELLIHGKGHLVRTDACWSRNPAIRRQSSRFLAGRWTTQCSTPPDDPREEKGTYSITKVSDDELRYVDVSRYNWQLKASRCTATITTVQTLHRSKDTDAPPAAVVTAAPEPEPEAPHMTAAEPLSPQELPTEEEFPVGPAEGQVEPAAEHTLVDPQPVPESPAPATRKPRCVPQAPARLTLTPEQAEVELGEEVCVEARAVDRSGCPLRAGAIRYRLEHSPALRGQLDGTCFRSSDSAAEGEGEYLIIATAGELQAKTQIAVKSMDLSSLIAKRLEVGAVTGFGVREAQKTPEPPPPATRVSTSAEKIVASDDGRFALIVALSGAAVALLVVAFFAVRRRRTAPSSGPARTHGSPPARATAAEPPPVQAPAPQPAPARQPQPTRTAGHSADPTASGAESWICPSCRRGYPAQMGTCPNCPPGHNRLMPYAEFAQRHQQRAGLKRCLDCGANLPGNINFCGQCGSRNLRPLGP